MTNKLLFQLIALVLLLSKNYFLQAQNQRSINVVTTAVPFLRISPDARAGGMGDAGIATGPGVSAVFWNIGKVPFAENKGGLTMNYTPWLNDWANDMYLASISGYYQLDDRESIHGSVCYFNLGDMQFSDNNGNHLQSFRPREFGINFGYTRKLSDRTGLGLGLKYIHSQLASKGAGGEDYKTGSAVAADLGFYYEAKNINGDGWAFGATLSNLGSKIKYAESGQGDYLPANFGLGTAYTRVFTKENRLIIALDINKLLVPTPPISGIPSDLVNYRSKSVVGSWVSSFGDASGGFSEEIKEVQVSFGTEYWYNEQFALRVGYSYEDKTKGGRQFLTLGMGIKYNLMGFDFSWLVPTSKGLDRNPLSNTLRFGLHFDLKKK